LALNALFIQAWLPGYSQTINSAGWSLSVEVFFYITFPLLLPIVARIRSSTGLLAILLGSWSVNLLVHIVLVDVAHSDHRITPLDDFSVYHPITHLATFVAGMCAARLFTLRMAACERWAMPMFAAALAGLAALPLIPDAAVRYHHNGLFVPLFSLLVLGLAAGRSRGIVRVLAWRPLEFLGEISYGLYILQLPIAWFYFALLAASGVHVSDDAKFGLLCFVLIASAAFCHFAVEAPLRTYINRHYRRVRVPTLAGRTRTSAAQVVVAPQGAASLEAAPAARLRATLRR
jgi:peptidoglycan/LPS O-acetylase OafA/YrhL